MESVVKLRYPYVNCKGLWCFQENSVGSLKRKFGKRLRHLRMQKGLTQEQLAEAAGLSVDFISNLERSVNAPSFETLERLSEVFHLEIRDLFDFTKDGF